MRLWIEKGVRKDEDSFVRFGTESKGGRAMARLGAGGDESTPL